MLATAVLLSLLVTAPGVPGRVTASFASPEPSMLEQLQRRHHSGQVLRVTNGTLRFECRAQDLDALGLRGITPRGHAAGLSDPIPWSSIERLDIVTTRTTYGRVMGAIVGGLGALILPAIPNGYSTQKPHQGRDYFFAGALVGGFAGGYLGSHIIREKPLYVAPVMPERPDATQVPPPVSVLTDSASVSVATADSSAGRAPAAPPLAVDTAQTPKAVASRRASSFAAETGPFVRRALLRIDSGRLLRIDCATGRFQGYASRADTVGLFGLRTEPSLSSVGGLRALRWEEIDRIEARGGSAGQGALRGAIFVGGAAGLLGALLGAAIDSYSGSSTYGTATAMIEGGAVGLGVGGAVGALFGGAIGASVPSWHTVYVRR